MNGRIALMCAAGIIIRDDVPDAEYRALAMHPEFAPATRILVESSGSGSGVLIAPQWVVTAAHVVAQAKVSALTVQIGNEKLSQIHGGKARGM
jgi:S1-C subfamily serine protease